LNTAPFSSATELTYFVVIGVLSSRQSWPLAAIAIPGKGGLNNGLGGAKAIMPKSAPTTRKAIVSKRLLAKMRIAAFGGVYKPSLSLIELETLFNPSSENPAFMAKKSMIERELKREKLIAKYSAKRQELKEQFASATSQQEKLEIHRQIQQLPRNSAPTRHRNRCWLTGRSRGYYRDFGLSRHVIREMAHQGLLPGVVKSSW
jgi:small subunit ribosomal protein S14